MFRQIIRVLAIFAFPGRSRATTLRRLSLENLENRQLLAVTPVGIEFLVNTTTTDFQVNASTAMDADGDFVVTWQSNAQDGSLDGIYAQRYDAAGAPQGNEFRVNTTTASSQSFPAVAMDADGDFVVAWQSNGQDGSLFGIYAQRFDALGVALGGEIRVNTFTSSSQSAPSIAMDADGDFVIAWQSNTQDGDLFGIYAQRFDAVGVAKGGEFRVNTATASTQSNPVVAMDASGDFVVAWQSNLQDLNGYGIYAQRYDSAGVAQGGEFGVNTTIANSQTVPSVAMDADGDFVIAWQSDLQDGSSNGVYAKRYNAAGVMQGTEFRVNTLTANSQAIPSVAMDVDGDFVVAWTSNLQDGSAQGVFAQRYNAAGAAQGAEFRVNTTTANIQSTPSIAIDADGDFVVAWQGDFQDGSSYGIYAQRYDESNSTAGPIVSEVRDGERRIVPGGRLSTTLDTLIVAFSENMNVVDGANGTNSVLNLANWQLTQDGVNISSQIVDIAFDLNGETNSYEAVLSFAAPLTAGTFQLTALASIRDTSGNSLDGDSNGAPGSNYNHSFAIANLKTAEAEFRVNASTQGNQRLSSSAMDTDGDFVVTWQSLTQGSYEIYAQRYNAAGVTQGSDFQVNTTTTDGQSNPSVAMDADGDFVVTWTGEALSISDVFAQRYNASGIAQGGEFRVNTTTASEQWGADVAMDANGNFVVTWHSFGQDGSEFGVFGQRYNAAGVAQGGEFQVNTTTANDQKSASVAMDADGDFVVTWESYFQDGSEIGIYAQRYNAAGVTQGGEFQVNTITDFSQSSPSAAMDSDGDFVVSWTSADQDGSLSNIYAQRYNAVGVAQGIEFRVNTTFDGIQTSPSVAMDADGDFVVSWQSEQDGNFFGIYAQRYKAHGVAQDGEFRVNTYTADSQVAPSVAMEAGGDFVVTWASDNQDGSLYGIYAQRYQLDSPVLLASGLLSLNGTNQADVMDVTSITPAGATAYLNVVRNGVNYTFDPTKVTNIAMKGLSGDDRLTLASNVTITSAIDAGVGNDVLGGGAGNDKLLGGSGNDFYLFDTDTALGSDIVTDISGVDTFDFSGTNSNAVSISLASTNNQVVNANLTLRLSAVNAIENIIGGSLSDTLTGNILANRITGNGGNDTLSGGAGNDTYVFDADLTLGTDTINEAGSGADTLDFSATTTSAITVNLANAALQTVTAANLALILSATNTIENVIGGALSDTITANSLSNSLVGGAGNDTYLFDSDTVSGSDTINDVSGIDTVNFSNTTTQAVALNLSSTAAQVVTAANLTLTLLGVNSIENAIGGLLGDTLTGNSLANTLTGGGGSDTLAGGAGDDLYLFDTDLALGSDTINDASGIDTLDFSATTTRSVVVDLSSTALQVANAGLSLTLSANNSIENVIGGSLGDTLTGNTLANTLTGGPGADSLTGGAGNDTYLFAANAALGADTINEAGGGIDTLDFSGTTTQAVAVNLSNAAAQVVNGFLTLTLSSTTTVENIIGGSLGDTLTGNTLTNILTGGGGSDVLTGGAGDDTYLFDTDLVLGGDTIDEAGGGIDTLDFSSTTGQTIVVDLSNAAAQIVTTGQLTLTLSANNTIENVLGGEGNDTLTGNALANRFTGGAGNDLLTGGSGSDVYFFDTDLNLGSDTINEAGGGSDLLNFGLTTTRAVSIDLSNAGFQTVNAGLMLSLSSGGTLESVIGGSLGDTLIGNALGNTLIGLGGDDLLVGGSGNDTYWFDTDAASGSDTIVESGIGADTLDFSATSTQKISVDLSITTPQVVNTALTLTLSTNNTIENVLGGALSDILVGNSLVNALTGNDGDDVLSGRAGDDILVGGNGKNILIGGDGADQLTGGTSEDLMLGARYTYENDFVALDSLLSEWTSASVFNNRVGHLLGTLAGGVHNGFTLTRSTVKEDSSADTLIGGTGQDWYLRNSLGTPIIFRDAITDADVDSVFAEIDSWF